ncbi:MAG TPA: hypothetical protein VFC05_15675 [Nitrososphaeraceae archaeon]|nr:hypothetical protein [Nitrososphaeraceae archaeon]
MVILFKHLFDHSLVTQDGWQTIASAYPNSVISFNKFAQCFNNP